MGTTFKCHFSPGLSLGSLKIRILVISKLWRLISFSNRVFFKNSRAIFYIPQKYFSNGLYHAPIEPHLTLAFKGFVVGNQIPNLTFTPFDHNS
jgi:hypothetical protein